VLVYGVLVLHAYVSRRIPVAFSTLPPFRLLALSFLGTGYTRLVSMSEPVRVPIALFFSLRRSSLPILY